MAARHDLGFQDPLDSFSRSRLIRLYKAARDDGHLPLPEVDSFRAGEVRGARQASELITGLVTPTSLAEYIDPQYTFGYYQGIRNIMETWAKCPPLELPAPTNQKASTESDSLPAPENNEHQLSNEEKTLNELITLKCQHIDALVSAHRGTSDNRHFGLQAYAFSERRDRALRLIAEPGTEPAQIRLARLRKASEALDCSLEFFRELAEAGQASSLTQPLQVSDELADPGKPRLLSGLATLLRRIARSSAARTQN